MRSHPVELAKVREMFGEPIDIAQQLERHALAERRRVEVGSLLEAYARIDEPGWPDHPPDSKAGREHLRHRADANQRRRVDRRHGLSREPQLAVGIVVDDERTHMRRDVGQLLPPHCGERHARRVVEVGHHVDQLWLPPTTAYVVECSSVEPVIVTRDRQDRRAGIA